MCLPFARSTGRNTRCWSTFFSFARGLLWSRGLPLRYPFMQVVDYVNTFMDLIRPTTGHPLSTLLAYIVYHIWLTRNAFAFDFVRPSAIVVLKRARVHAQELLSLIAVTSETRGFCSAP